MRYLRTETHLLCNSIVLFSPLGQIFCLPIVGGYTKGPFTYSIVKSKTVTLIKPEGDIFSLGNISEVLMDIALQ